LGFDYATGKLVDPNVTFSVSFRQFSLGGGHLKKSGVVYITSRKINF